MKLILFSFELLAITLTDSPPPHSLCLDQPAQNIHRVLKDADRLRQLFNHFRDQGFTLVCFSGKKPTLAHEIFSKIAPGVRWTYVAVEPKSNPGIVPNHAKLKVKDDEPYDVIEYGEGLGGCEVKQQLTIAIQSALSIRESDRSSVVVFEKKNSDISHLKSLGYSKILHTVPTVEQFDSLIQQQSEAKENKLLDNIIENSDTIAEISLAYDYFEDKKALTVGLKPNNCIRSPNSRSASSYIFKNPANDKPYIIKSQLPHQIGGDVYYEKQENKVVSSVIYQIVSSPQSKSQVSLRCLPMQLMKTSMKFCLIKAYQNKKSTFFVRPYVKGIQKLSEVVGNNPLLIKEILTRSQINSRTMKGMGEAITLALLIGEDLSSKSLFESIALMPGSEEKELICCKIDFSCSLFNKFGSDGAGIRLLPDFDPISLDSLSEAHSQQIKRTLVQCLRCLPIIEGALQHPSWSRPKTAELLRLKANLLVLGKKYNILNEHSQLESLPTKIEKVGSIDSKYFNYLIGEDKDFCHFTAKPLKSFSSFFTSSSESEYVEKMKDSYNFIVYGSQVPVFSLIKWIRSIYPAQEVEYISLLLKKPGHYETRTKVAKNEGKKVVFVIDHCELEGCEQNDGKSITELNRGFKTIFIYRLIPPQCKRLKIIYDFPKYEERMEESSEELFKVLLRVSEETKGEGQFGLRFEMIEAWMSNRWGTYFSKSKLFSLQEVKESLKKLVYLISHKRNRLLLFLNHKWQHEGEITSSERTITSTETDSRRKTFPYLAHYETSFLLLYCLPIHIRDQRVYLINDLYSFLQAYYLYEAIMTRTWDGEFDADELPNFLTWSALLSGREKQGLCEMLMGQLEEFYRSALKEGSSTKRCNECLEFLRKLGVTKLFANLSKIFYYQGNLLSINAHSDSELYLMTDKNVIAFNSTNAGWTQSQFGFSLAKPFQDLIPLSFASVPNQQSQQRAILIQREASLDQSNQLIVWDYSMIGGQPAQMPSRTILIVLPGKKLNKIASLSLVCDEIFVLVDYEGNMQVFVATLTQSKATVAPDQMVNKRLQLKEPMTIGRVDVQSHREGSLVHLIVAMSGFNQSKLPRIAVSRLALSLEDGRIAITDVESHCLPQLSPVACVGIRMRDKADMSMWVFNKGSDAVDEWVIGKEGWGVRRRVYKMEPNPSLIVELSARVLLVGSHNSYLKMMSIE